MNPQQPQGQDKPTTPTPENTDNIVVNDSTQPTSSFDGTDPNSNVEANEAALQAIESLESENSQPETATTPEQPAAPVTETPVTSGAVSTPEAPAAADPSAPAAPEAPADQPKDPAANQPIAPFPTQAQPSSKRTLLLVGAVVALIVIGVIGYFVIESL